MLDEARIPPALAVGVSTCDTPVQAIGRATCSIFRWLSMNTHSAVQGRRLVIGSYWLGLLCRFARRQINESERLRPACLALKRRRIHELMRGVLTGS